MYAEFQIGTKKVLVASNFNKIGKEKFTVIYFDTNYSTHSACQDATNSLSRKKVVEEINKFFGEPVAEIKGYYGISFLKQSEV